MGSKRIIGRSNGRDIKKEFNIFEKEQALN